MDRSGLVKFWQDKVRVFIYLYTGLYRSNTHPQLIMIQSLHSVQA